MVCSPIIFKQCLKTEHTPKDYQKIWANSFTRFDSFKLARHLSAVNAFLNLLSVLGTLPALGFPRSVLR
jgi:hypothetical protein